MKIPTIQGLIKEQCAYHDNEAHNVKNHCYTGEMPNNQCIYFYDDKDDWYIIRCKYFEECVLPLNHDLEVKYYEDLKIDGKIISKDEKTKTCECCGKTIKVKTNRQKFCDKCAAKNRREAVRKNTKKYRRKK